MYSIESEHWMSLASEYALANLFEQVTSYTNRLGQTSDAIYHNSIMRASLFRLASLIFHEMCFETGDVCYACRDWSSHPNNEHTASLTYSSNTFRFTSTGFLDRLAQYQQVQRTFKLSSEWSSWYGVYVAKEFSYDKPGTAEAVHKFVKSFDWNAWYDEFLTENGYTGLHKQYFMQAIANKDYR